MPLIHCHLKTTDCLWPHTAARETETSEWMAMSHIAWAASLGLEYDLCWKQEQKKAKEIFTMHAFRLMPRLSTPTLSSTKATEWPWPILQLSNINQKRSWRTSRKSVSSVLISTVWKCVEMCGKESGKAYYGPYGWSSEWAPSLLLAWPSAASLPRQKSKAGEHSNCSCKNKSCTSRKKYWMGQHHPKGSCKAI